MILTVAKFGIDLFRICKATSCKASGPEFFGLRCISHYWQSGIDYVVRLRPKRHDVESQNNMPGCDRSSSRKDIRENVSLFSMR